jgi:hypothetical protein
LDPPVEGPQADREADLSAHLPEDLRADRGSVNRHLILICFLHRKCPEIKILYKIRICNPLRILRVRIRPKTNPFHIWQISRHS